MNDYFEQARHAHLNRFLVSAAELYRKAYVNDGLSLRQKGFWLDALVALGDSSGANALLSEMQGEALTPEDVSWLQTRESRHEGPLNNWRKREILASDFNEKKLCWKPLSSHFIFHHMADQQRLGSPPV